MDPNSNQPGMPNTTPISPMQGRPMPANGQKKVGPIIATLVIVLILIIAALYLFASRINQPSLPSDTSTDSASASQSVQPVTGTSDDPHSLQNDLNNSTTGLDKQNF